MTSQPNPPVVTLPPCPFCGGEPKSSYVTGMASHWAVWCDKCHASTGEFGCEPFTAGKASRDAAKVRAETAWNTRTSSAPPAQSGELVEAQARAIADRVSTPQHDDNCGCADCLQWVAAFQAAKLALIAPQQPQAHAPSGLAAMLAFAVSCLCSLRKNYEQDLPLWDDVSKAIAQGNAALAQPQAAVVDQLWAALEKAWFLNYWRVDGMNTEQARTHAQARVAESKASLAALTAPVEGGS